MMFLRFTRSSEPNSLAFIAWIAIAALTAKVARSRGRPPIPWLFIGLMFPGVAVLFLLLLRRRLRNSAATGFGRPPPPSPPPPPFATPPGASAPPVDPATAASALSPSGWHLLLNADVLGPFTLDELRTRLRDLRGDGVVWCADFKSWVAARQVPGLRG